MVLLKLGEVFKNLQKLEDISLSPSVTRELCRQESVKFIHEILSEVEVDIPDEVIKQALVKVGLTKRNDYIINTMTDIIQKIFKVVT